MVNQLVHHIGKRRRESQKDFPKHKKGKPRSVSRTTSGATSEITSRFP